jgi:hypothetical protein
VHTPLTNRTRKGCFVWAPEHQQGFNAMKALIVQDCILRYLDHNKPFNVHTSASNYQLAAILVQEGIPVTYYSQKLTNAQKNYATLEMELLSIFMTFN